MEGGGWWRGGVEGGGGGVVEGAVFSPEFTGRRAQIISHDHTHHLECSDC